jgi:transcriptional regulator with XRE-family HTH domain
MTQEELSIKAGISRPSLSALERAGIPKSRRSSQPASARPSTLRNLARALDCDPQDLMKEARKTRQLLPANAVVPSAPAWRSETE